MQLGGFLGILLGPLLKTGLPLMKNVLKPLASGVSTPLGLTVAASAAVAGIYKKNLGFGVVSFGPSKVNNINNFKWRNELYHENS